MAAEQEQLLHQIYRCSRCVTLYVYKFSYVLFIYMMISLVGNTAADTESLYKPSDPLFELTNDTIMEQIIGNDKVWIIEFYSSWCGHCQAFAPKWVRLAIQLQNWQRYINVGAINCVAERNHEICRKFSINMYPTIKFFDVNWQNITDEKDEEYSQKMGITYRGVNDITDIRHRLIDHIENQTNAKYDKSDIPYRFVREDVVSNYIEKKNVYKYFAMIFEEPKSYVGKTLIMDSSNSKHLLVRRVSHEHKSILKTTVQPMLAWKIEKALTKKYKVNEFPSLVVIVLGKEGYQHVSSNNRTYLGFLYALQGIVDFMAKPPKPVENDVKAIETPKLEVASNVSSEVYMVDLLSAVSYTLRREVAKKPVIKQNALIALKDWVNLLVQCFPAEKYILSFLMKLDLWLQNNSPGEKIHSADYLKFIEDNQITSSYLPQKIEWMGCRGSKPKYRGFPCSLWTLFHTMTVECGSKYSKNTLTGLDVLKRIRGFIDHYFGCRYCRDHFVEMAKDLEREVSTHDSAILWLWEAHNKVNARLKEDLSSDPQFPKIQFPSESMCEECRGGTSIENTIVTDPGYGAPVVKWNQELLLEFLKDYFGPDNINVKDKSLSGRTELKTEAARHKFTYKFYPRARKMSSLSFIGLTRIDVSLCVLLYIAVIGTLIALYLYFIKRRKKKQWKNII